MSFMQRLAYKMKTFMTGRYGVDQFSIAILIFGMILSVILSFTTGFPWYYLSYIPYFYVFYRILSRKIESRRHENNVFLKLWNPIFSWSMFKKAAFKDRHLYKYFQCPTCRLHLRAPKGKGKIQITCQRCHSKFIKKT